MAANLPRLVAERPLPAAHAGRTLHYRLVGETAAAVTPLPLSIRLRDAEAATRRAAERAHADRSSPQYSRPAMSPASREAAASPRR